MSSEKETKIIENPVVTIDNFYNTEKTLVIHSHISQGKMLLNKEEALLLLVELYSFVQ